MIYLQSNKKGTNSNGLKGLVNYAEYLLLSAAAVSVLVGLFVLFPAYSKPPVNPYREGQSVLAPPESLSVSFNTGVSQ